MGSVIPFDELESFYDEPGEYGWILEAHKHGFARVSLIVTDTMPGGGPPRSARSRSAWRKSRRPGASRVDEYPRPRQCRHRK